MNRTMHGVQQHSQEAFRQIAEQGTILLSEVGSGAHGIAIEGTDDRDEMGICIEPAEYLIGLKTGEGGVPFEQYAMRTAVERAVREHDDQCKIAMPHEAHDCPLFDVAHVRSGPGDVDLTIYSLRKWMKLAINGNPSVLVPLFTPEESCEVIMEYGQRLRENTDSIISRKAGLQFLGYLGNQRDSMTGVRKPKVNRPELIEAYGYDTKYASHAVRLGYQGIELMQTGRITLPMPDTERLTVREIKTGKWEQADVLELVTALAAGIEEATAKAPFRDQPDVGWASEFLVEAYQVSWEIPW